MGTAIIAVIGTLLGSVATYYFQRQAAERTAARQALIRVQLVCADRESVELARTAFELTHCMHEAPNEAERARRSEQADEALASFIEAAAPSVR